MKAPRIRRPNLTAAPRLDDSVSRILERRAADLNFTVQSTVLIEDAGTPLIVTRVDDGDVPILLHAQPTHVELGVLEEPRFPLVSVVATLDTAVGPRYAGLFLNIGKPIEMGLLHLLAARNTIDLAVLDPCSRLATVHRFDLPLWTRAQALRVIAQAEQHLSHIPEGRRSFERARDEFVAYCTQNLTA